MLPGKDHAGFSFSRKTAKQLMTISSRLIIIIFLTVMEVSATVWAAFEIAKGSRFHQLNYLHLHANHEMETAVDGMGAGRTIDVEGLRALVRKIRAYPVECVEKINVLTEFFMQQIGTQDAIRLCLKDIDDANSALANIELYETGALSSAALVTVLQRASAEFSANSEAFEPHITRTVSLLFNTLIPFVLFLSLFNIFSIFYLSRKIQHSIRDVISLLDNESANVPLKEEIDSRVFGELKELVTAAIGRIKRDWINREMKQELEVIVKNRTQQLEQANDELSQFAYRASHDLKGPLTTMKGLAGMIEYDIGDGNLDEAKYNARRIADQMVQLECLIVDILELARADVASESVEKVLIKELLSEICERQGMMMSDSEVKLTIDVDENHCVRSSRTRLKQVLENLIVNAFKYRNPENKNCFVTVSSVLAGEGLNIIVKDNGLGIPESMHKAVFEMFTRFHPDAAAGTGLGLSIVKKHVDRIGAVISFDSSDQGTAFTLELPACAGSVA